MSMSMSTKRDDGGPVHPTANKTTNSITGADLWVDYESRGMTIRDWFAEKALMGALANPAAASEYAARGPGVFAIYAISAFAFADAMLAERSKP